MSTSNQDSQNTSLPREESSQLPATSQGYVLPEGKIMPNTIFVGGIDIRMDETEIQNFFSRYGTVKEVKIITDRTGVSKGYGFVSFLDNVDVQKIVEVSTGEYYLLEPYMNPYRLYLDPDSLLIKRDVILSELNHSLCTTNTTASK